MYMLKHSCECYMKNKVRGAAEMLIKHKAKPSGLLASRPSAEYFMVDVHRVFWQVLLATHNRFYCESHGEVFP